MHGVSNKLNFAPCCKCLCISVDLVRVREILFRKKKKTKTTYNLKRRVVLHHSMI